MTTIQLISSYIVAGGAILWLIACGVLASRFEKLENPNPLVFMLIAWPFSLVEEAIQLLPGGSYLAGMVGVFTFVPLLVMAFAYTAIRPKVTKISAKSLLLPWLPVLLALGAQVPLLFVAPETKHMLYRQAPIGDPLGYWYVYLPYWISGFGCLVIGIVLTEILQVYHRYLPEQVVDIDQFKLKGMAGVMATTVGIGFICIVVVSFVAFGILPFEHWQTLFHLCFATMTLLVLMYCLDTKRSSPSPINYQRLENTVLGSEAMKAILQRAERAVIEHKAYKKVGLRMIDFAAMANVEPTELAITTRALLKRNFRAFIFHYRLEYAKKVLLRSDAKISAVAKRLGFNSEKFLSGVFVKYMNKFETHD